MAVSEDNVDQFQYSVSINRRYWDNNYTFENFQQNPSVSKEGGGASSGTTGAVNLMVFPTSAFEYAILGAGQTITAPSITTVSGNPALNPELDVVYNEGIEICSGILSSNLNAFKVGSAEAFFFRTRMQVGTVIHSLDCAMGFRKAEAYQADIDDYSDMAVFNMVAGDIEIQTIQGGGATQTTDTTDDWADGEIKDLQVSVDGSGVVTFQINGQPPTVTDEYTFTDALTVIPFFYLLHDSTNTNVISFDIDFVALNSIVATVNGVALAPVVFNTDQATTIAALAAAIGAVSEVVSSTVTDTKEITVVFEPGGANVVDSVITTLGVSQPTATIDPTGDATLGCSLLEWECGFQN